MKSKTSKRNQVYFSFTFAFVAALCLMAAFRFFGSQPKMVQGIASLERLQQQLPSPYVDLESKTSELGKERRKFWATDSGQVEAGGITVNLLEEEALFQSVFPNYQRSQFGDEFWKSYFKFSFNLQTWSSELSQYNGTGVFVFQPEEACEKILSAVGGEIVSVGSSEMYRSIVPSQISVNQRYVNCGKPSMTLQQMAKTVHLLAQQPKTIEWLVLGLSYWQAREPIRQSHYSTLPPFTSFKLSEYFSVPSYSNIFGESYQEIRNSAQQSKNQKYEFESPIHLRLPKKLSPSSLSIKNWLRDYQKVTAQFQQIKFEECEMKQFKKELSAILQEAGKISRSILVYLPPVTSEFLYGVPECYTDALRETIYSFRSDNILTLVNDNAQFSVEESDFLYPGKETDSVVLDLHHLNYRGAEKVTRVLKEQMERFRNLPVLSKL